MKLIPNAVTMRCARQALVASKNSPALLFGAGVIGVIGTTVLASRASMKLEEVVTTAQNDLEIVRNMDDEDYSDRERQKDIAYVYGRSVLKLGKMYAPAVVLGAASIAALTTSHNILNRRNMALTAAYAAVERGFAEYRTRVVDKYGYEQDQEFRYATEKVEVVNDKGKKVKEIRVSPDAATIYARFFDNLSSNWNKEAEYNLIFLKAQQLYLNDLLQTRGHVFLNEVYYSLDIPHSGPGSVVGWLLGNGDNFIDFGIWDNKEGSRAFVNGREGAILLDFNVDGVIFDKIDARKAEEGIPWQK